jgi:hypothetical protein
MALLVIVLQAISVYMVAALVLPDVTGDTLVDLRQHYFAHRSWFFAALFMTVLFSAAKDFVLKGQVIGGLNAEFHVVVAVAAVVAAITRREWFHNVLAPVLALAFFVYIALLFARL